VRPLPPTQGHLGRAIRQLREERELSIEALAAASEMHPTYLSGIERGRFNPSWGKLRSLATALEVPISAIVDRAEQQAASEDPAAGQAEHSAGRS
jgi:transcriptional regulator with XRE-family HTH domain